MTILGIDPGSVICGYGVIKSEYNKLQLVEYGVIKAKVKSVSIPNRLKEIFNRLGELIQRTKPDASAFETMFYSKNVQSLMKLSHARGAAMVAASLNNVPVFEYSPREVKKSVTGRGNASKEQVQFMVKKILDIKETPEFYDVTDALAAAICHSFRATSITNGNSKSWKEYIERHPERILTV